MSYSVSEIKGKAGVSQNYIPIVIAKTQNTKIIETIWNVENSHLSLIVPGMRNGIATLKDCLAVSRKTELGDFSGMLCSFAPTLWNPMSGSHKSLHSQFSQYLEVAFMPLSE